MPSPASWCSQGWLQDTHRLCTIARESGLQVRIHLIQGITTIMNLLWWELPCQWPVAIALVLGMLGFLHVSMVLSKSTMTTMYVYYILLQYNVLLCLYITINLVFTKTLASSQTCRSPAMSCKFLLWINVYRGLELPQSLFRLHQRLHRLFILRIRTFWQSFDKMSRGFRQTAWRAKMPGYFAALTGAGFLLHFHVALL